MATTVCELKGVRDHSEGYPVELVLNEAIGRFVLRAWNEGHNNTTEIDLIDLIAWCSLGPADRRVGDGFILTAGTGH